MKDALEREVVEDLLLQCRILSSIGMGFILRVQFALDWSNQRSTRMPPSDDAELVKAGAEGVVAGAMRPFAQMIEKVFGPAAEEAGLTLRDSVRGFRLRRQVRLWQRCKEMLDNAGIEPKAIPLKLLLLTIECASIEEDDVLQDRWAALLANNAMGNHTQTSFQETLRQLSGSDARLLRVCFHETFCSFYNKFSPPWKTPVNRSVQMWERPPFANLAPPTNILSIENVIRLGLIERYHADSDAVEYYLTLFGYLFVEACEEPAQVLKLRLDQQMSHPAKFEDFDPNQ